MKRTITGMDAYSKMLSTPLPAKTATYTPISHSSVIHRMRTEITKAGFIISNENYRCTNDGQVAVGSLTLNYKSDPDIVLAANFTNSYNKQLAFRFGLGGIVKVCSNGMVITNDKFGRYKKIHKGEADILAEGKISEFISDADSYWETLIEHKEIMKDVILSKAAAYDLIGQLFFDEKVLNTMQLNIIKNEIERPSFSYGAVDSQSAWVLYNHITHALKECHPSEWMESQATVHSLFDAELKLSPIPVFVESEPVVSESETSELDISEVDE